MTAYPGIVVANYVVQYCLKKKKTITNLQLQKILYFIEGESFLKNKRSLISDDFYAWKLGPVIPNVYDRYCPYGAFPIVKATPISFTIQIDDRDLSLINRVVDSCIDVPVWDLVEKTHKKGPWKLVKDDNDLRITKDLIEKHWDLE